MIPQLSLADYHEARDILDLITDALDKPADCNFPEPCPYKYGDLTTCSKCWRQS